MEDARKMGKSELFSHFAERFDIKRTQSREFFDELAALCEKELKRTGEFVIPGMVKLVLKRRTRAPAAIPPPASRSRSPPRPSSRRASSSS